MKTKIIVGSFTIEWIDEDHILITKKYEDKIFHTAKITGGDMETFLGGIFLNPKITYKCGGMTTVTTHKTTYELEITEETQQPPQ